VIQRPDSAAAIVVADDAVGILELIDGKLEDRRQIPVVGGNDIGDVAVGENLSREGLGDTVDRTLESESPIQSTVGFCP
jgi:hypothetical protein